MRKFTALQVWRGLFAAYMALAPIGPIGERMGFGFWPAIALNGAFTVAMFAQLRDEARRRKLDDALNIRTYEALS